MLTTPRPLEEYRSLFPALSRHVYLNHAGVAPISTRVRSAVDLWLDDCLNDGALHVAAWDERVERARSLAARLVGARPQEIALVRNTSHGLGAVAEGLEWRSGDEVAVCTAEEYPSNVYPWLHLAPRGVAVREIAPERGGVTPAMLRAALTERTRLVAVSAVQYASGHRTDLDAIGRLCRERGILLCVDGIQGLGAVPIDVKAAGVHFLSADAHKWLLGPAGIGLLFIDESVIGRVRPSVVGWRSTTEALNFDRCHFVLRSDAAKLEEGTPNYLGIYGLEAALELILEVGPARIALRLEELLARLERGLARLGCDVSPGAADRAGMITFAPPPPLTGTALAPMLTASRFGVSLRRGRVRVSPHFYTTDAEADALVDFVARAT